MRIPIFLFNGLLESGKTAFINEMLKNGIVDCIGKKKCQYSGKSVGVFTLRHICELCGQEIGDFNDNGIYEGKYCEECFNEAEESRM